MIDGLTISDYRSIGEKQVIAPFGKINLFVGPNNSGKSNVLRFINENLQLLLRNTRRERTTIKSDPHSRRGKPTHASLGIALSKDNLRTLFKISAEHNAPQLLTKIYAELTEPTPNNLLWIDDQWPQKELIRRAVGWARGSIDWHQLWTMVTNLSGGDLTADWIPETLDLLRNLAPQPLDVFAIPINREAGRESEPTKEAQPFKILGGKGVIRSLAAMDRPDHTTFDEDRKRFIAIQDFVRTVTDDPEATINIPHTLDKIQVQMKGQRYFPLADLGSGIEQVVLHAVAATSASNAVVTFEEPELHLHPVLQRQLLTYLAATTNQYFIATHSAHIIDMPEAHTFHVRLVNGETVIKKAISDEQRHMVCYDLGYRPSDIVQANCVLWVEGPSDKIYISHWLSSFDIHLKEGVHYSIMFYGGKLLSHLSAGETDTVDDGLKDLIQLRMLNRQLAVVMDSDLTAEGGSIRETKARVKKEIEDNGGFVWVTAGREIENYHAKDVLSAAVEQVAPGLGKSVHGSKFGKALPNKSKSKQSVDKVRTAEIVIKSPCNPNKYDLRERIKELSAFIREANGLSSFSP